MENEEKTNMTDEEFIEFMRENKDRVKAFMKEEDGEFAKYLKKKAKKAKKKAKKAKKMFEEGFDEAGTAVKGVKDAVFSPEVQKHIVSAGIEMMLGITALIDAIPKGEKTQEAYDRAEEMRHNISSIVCAKNPDCARRKPAEEKKEDVRKIEID